MQSVNCIGAEALHVVVLLAEGAGNCAIAPRDIQATAVGANPEVSVVVLGNRRGAWTAERLWFLWVIGNVAELAGAWIQNTDSAAEGADPDPPVRVLEQSRYAVRRQAVAIAGNVTPSC